MIHRITLYAMLLLAGCARDDREARRRAAGPNATLAGYLRVADAGAGGVRTPARMDRWLRSPAAFAPGTRMASAGIADPLERADIIAFLSSQGPTR